MDREEGRQPQEAAVYRLERVIPVHKRVQSALLSGVYLERTSVVMPDAPRDLFTASELSAFLNRPENRALLFRVSTV